MKTIRLATRGSELALVQAEQIRQKLEMLGTEEHPIRVEIKKVVTQGDRDRTNALSSIGGNGLFVRGIEEELITGGADIAVHCAKDLPYELHPELTIAGVPEAADMRDMLISPADRPLLLLHENIISGQEYLENTGTDHPVIGTGSPRRRTELQKLIPDAQFAENRGNIPTRLRKLADGQFDAIVLAKAGVDRLQLDLSKFHVHVFGPEEMIPAAGQGILAIECRKDDTEIRSLLEKITDEASLRRFTIERYLFALLKADCSMPVGVVSEMMYPDQLSISGMFGTRKSMVSGPSGSWKQLCEELAKRLREDT